MVVTLSDYIMEQEVSSASCDDIVLEQLQAQIDVNLALANAYLKEYMMLEYASVYTEAKDDLFGEKKEKGLKAWLKRMWEAIKGFFAKIKTKIVQFTRWIKTKLGGDAIKRLDKIWTKGSDEDCKRYLVAILNKIAKSGIKLSSKVELNDVADLTPDAKHTDSAYHNKDVQAIIAGFGDPNNIDKALSKIEESNRDFLGEVDAFAKDIKGIKTDPAAEGFANALLKKSDAIDVAKLFESIDIDIDIMADPRKTLEKLAKALDYYKTDGIDKIKKISAEIDRVSGRLNALFNELESVKELSSETVNVVKDVQFLVGATHVSINVTLQNILTFVDCVESVAFKTFKPKDDELGKYYDPYWSEKDDEKDKKKKS